VTTTRIGFVGLGTMGGPMARRLAGSGYAVLWAPEGRSPATGARAEQAGLTSARDVGETVRQADIIMSICPPMRSVMTGATLR